MKKFASRIIRVVAGVTSRSNSRVGFAIAHTALYRKFGFTLAEVLITLGIIGVVAALTMPSLIVKHQKLQTVTRLKKAYSELNQAIRLSENKYGLMETWNFENFSSPAERVNYFFDNYLSPNIKIIKKCETENQSECWTDNLHNLDRAVSLSAFKPIDGHLTFITSSGMSYLIWIHSIGTGGWFWVDINGPKNGPNTLGKDIFSFNATWIISSDSDDKIGVFPYGAHQKQPLTRDEIKNGFGTGALASYNCLKNTGKVASGATCGALIMYDGWQIAPDYPW